MESSPEETPDQPLSEPQLTPSADIKTDATARFLRLCT